MLLVHFSIDNPQSSTLEFAEQIKFSLLNLDLTILLSSTLARENDLNNFTPRNIFLMVLAIMRMLADLREIHGFASMTTLL